KQVAKQLELGVIQPSKSEWAAAPHFVKKKTGEWRCVIDYRRLNAAMTADSYPLPRIWDHLRRVAGQRYYCTLDMNSGFWNVPIEEGSKATGNRIVT
ncbi:RNA-directed DNA polymerase, partial [Gregarina niphandrodes]